MGGLQLCVDKLCCKMDQRPFVRADFGNFLCFCVQKPCANDLADWQDEGPEMIQNQDLLKLTGPANDAPKDSASLDAIPSTPQRRNARVPSVHSSTVNVLITPSGSKLSMIGTLSPHETQGNTEEMPAQPATSVVATLHRGRTIEAYRWVEQMERDGADVTKVLDEHSLAWLRHAYETDQHFISTFSLDKESLPEYEREDDCYPVRAFQTSGGFCHLVTRSFCRSASLMHAFVGVCEFDLCSHFLDDVAEVEPVKTMVFQQSLYRLLRSRAREDNVAEVSCIDALDDETSALRVSVSFLSPPDEWQMDGPRENFTRNVSDTVVYQFRRRWAASTTGNYVEPDGWDLTIGSVTSLSTARHWCALVAPTRFRRGLAVEARAFLERFQRFLQCKAHVIEQRMRDSPRATFYEHVRQHLDHEGAP